MEYSIKAAGGIGTSKPIKEKLEFIGDYSMENMIRRAVMNAKHNFPKTEFNWCAVQKVFGYGSTTSIQLCEHFGLNPWKEVQDKQ